jgi:predicted CXXCH cytochrome family protein
MINQRGDCLMKKLRRFIISIGVALFLAGITYLLAQAKVGANPVTIPAEQLLGQQKQAQQKVDCSMCHPSFSDTWANGAHGHSMTDTKFSEMWTDQGKPGACLVCHATGYDPATLTYEKDAVSCASCHDPIPEQHSYEPSKYPVPVDRSNDLCATCHSDTRFGLQEWQTSTHYQRAMTCSVCHDPHSAALKDVKGMETSGPSGLCINCHSEVSMNFPYSTHNQAGVSCVDCHLRHFEQQGNEDIHAMPDHSFSASLATCTSCHSEEMHEKAAPADNASAGNPTAESTQAATTPVPALVSGPAPVGPFGFSVLAGLLGLAGGMVLQPWLERTYHNINRKKGVKK